MELFQLVDAVDVLEAHTVTVFEAATHRLADERRDPEQPREVARMLVDRRGSAHEDHAAEPKPAAQRNADRGRAQRMADRRVEGSVSRRERFEGAHEIGKRDRVAFALAVSRLIEPDDAIAAGGERRDEAPKLHAPAAP